jgi:hypothetical protein
MKKILVALLGIGIIHSAFAEKTKEFAKADTAELFAATEASIRKDMEKDGRFEFITPAEKAAANHDLDTMMDLLKKAGSVSVMSMQDKVALFNTQEHLNGILTHSDSERLVCERNDKVGSHIQTTTCRTYGEIQRVRRDTQDLLSRNMSNDPQLQNQNCPVVKLGTNMASACASQAAAIEIA